MKVQLVGFGNVGKSLIALTKEKQKTLKSIGVHLTIAREIEACRLQSAANAMISISRIGNQYLNEKEPWDLIKKDRKKAANVFYASAQVVKALAIASDPFVPVAAEEIWKTLNLPEGVHQQKWDEALKPFPPDHRIAKARPLFRKIHDNPKELEEKLQK